MLLMLLSFSWLLLMVKSTLFLSLIKFPSTRTLLLIRIRCFCSTNELFSAIVEFHLQIDVSCYDTFWRIQSRFIAKRTKSRTIKRAQFTSTPYETHVKSFKLSICTNKITLGNLHFTKIKQILPLAEKIFYN